MLGNEPEGESRTGRLKLRLEVLVAILALLGFFGINQFTDLIPGGSSDHRQPGSAPASPAVPTPQRSTGPAPTTGPVLPPFTSPSVTTGVGPTLTVAPGVVAVGQRFSVRGSGFAPGAKVTIENGAFFAGFDQADASGRVEVFFPAIDQAFCSSPTAELTAVVDDVPVASATARFCG